MTKLALALLFGSAAAGFTLPVSAQTPAAKPAPAAAPAMMKPAAAPPAMMAAPAAPAAAPGPDMTKVGPMSRKVTKEDKKGIADVYKAWDEGWKKGDGNALAELVDFPLLMMSDDSKGEEKHVEATREQFVGMVMGIGAMSKDAKITGKHTPIFLSDSLAVAPGNFNMTMGKVKGSWHGFDVLTLKDGKWKFKQIAEAGWGDMVGGPPAMAPSMAPKPAPMMAPPAHPAAAPAAAPAAPAKK